MSVDSQIFFRGKTYNKDMATSVATHRLGNIEETTIKEVDI